MDARLVDGDGARRRWSGGAASRDGAYRVVHAEGDGLPSLIVDRYGDCAVAQLLSAGLEAVRDDVIAAIRDVLAPEGPAAPERRRRCGSGSACRATSTLAFGEVPEEIEVEEAPGVRYLAAPWTGQKTGAFLDQRENRRLFGAMPGARCLDAFAYHGRLRAASRRGGARGGGGGGDLARRARAARAQRRAERR